LDSVVAAVAVAVSFSGAGDNDDSILIWVWGLGVGSVIGLDSIVFVISVSGVGVNASIFMWVFGLVNSFIGLDSVVDDDVDVDVNVSNNDDEDFILKMV